MEKDLRNKSIKACAIKALPLFHFPLPSKYRGKNAKSLHKLHTDKNVTKRSYLTDNHQNIHSKI